MFDVKKRYGILGMARSGLAAAYKIKELGGKVFLSELMPEDRIEQASQVQSDFECEFGGHTDELLHCDEWIVSPGIPLTAPIIVKGRNFNIPMISEVEFGYQIKHQDSKIIAVTGSNGKSTTASLVHHILTKMGKKSLLAGNIGQAFTAYPVEKPVYEYIVLEVSSFQLDLINHFKADAAVLLNITPDHLNRYLSFGHYVESKFRVFDNQTEEDHAIINLDSELIFSRSDRIKATKHFFSNFTRYPEAFAWANGKFLHFGEDEKISKFDLSLRGPHNHLNVLAATLAAYTLTGQLAEAVDAIHGFKPLSHRLEPVGDIGGVFFYNDSKATNTDSVKSALESFEHPIRIIMGGSDKGEDFNVLTDVLIKRAKKVYVNGETSAKMRQAWMGKLPLDCHDDLQGSTRAAFEDSLAGDNIVLSPGCASFDQFKNFEDRGDSFRRIVQEIIMEHEKS